MSDLSFGRTVRSQRTKLGLSQAKLGELVGRSQATVRSWEREKSQPTDPSVILALAAVLGVDEDILFDRAGQPKPVQESSPTMEQELASLSPVLVFEDQEVDGVEDDLPADDLEPREQAPAEQEVTEAAPETVEDEEEPESSRRLAPVPDPEPSFTSPPPPYLVTTAIPPAHEPSYMEQRSQRALYRVRSLATVVALVALGIALLWALSETFGAIGDWWDQFFGSLRL